MYEHQLLSFQHAALHVVHVSCVFYPDGETQILECVSGQIALPVFARAMELRLLAATVSVG